ncbi:MAG: membrane-bound serine protease (ClpP class) [Pseudoalteromonas distincta]|jgi:membrane-bound serine protease (ClpP class)
MALSVIIGLIVLGILLILVEIFFTPGFIIGLVGAATLVVGLVNTYSEYGYAFGNITLIGVLVFLGTVIVLAFKNGIWNRFAIADVIVGKANNIDKLTINIGDVGETISAIRPAGSAIIGGQKMEVHTEGSLLLAKEAIVVTKILNNKIYVEKTN